MEDKPDLQIVRNEQRDEDAEEAAARARVRARLSEVYEFLNPQGGSK